MKAWLFDIDGVLTDPAEKKVKEPRIIRELIKRLENGDVLGLNTGRSIDFVVKEVLVPLEEKVKDQGIYKRIFAVGEKGGVWIAYENGRRKDEIDSELKPPLDLQEKVKKLIEEEFSDSMFFDDTKKTMVSTEMKKGYSIQEYQKRQKTLNKKLAEIVDSLSIKDMKIDPTTIASDVEFENVGKAPGAKRFIELLEERGFNPDEYICFGDSRSDFEMGEELERQHKNFSFIYVGEDTEDYPDFMIFRPKERYDKGTLEYLSGNS